MPEGDTIHRTARNLARVLEGRALTGYHAVLPRLDPPDLVGTLVERVRAHGKNLLIHFADGRVLLSHMKMTGSWHIYRPGERWKKSRRAARVILENHAFVAVCFDAPTIELLSPTTYAQHPILTRLGPDLLAHEFDARTAAERLLEESETEIGVRIMEQHAVAGIGNIYKSEVLFIERLHPFTPTGQFGIESLVRLLQTTRRLMQANLDTPQRITRWPRPGQRPTAPALASMRRAPVMRGGALWVYHRQGRSCYVCGNPILMRRQGPGGRSTYFCPMCQAFSSSNSG